MYAGKARNGQAAKGELDAADRDVAIGQLRTQGIRVASIEEKKKGKTWSSSRGSSPP